MKHSIRKIRKTLDSLPINNNLSVDSNGKINVLLTDLSHYLAKNLNSQAIISTGSTSPSASKSYFRLYIEWAGNETHNANHKNYYMVDYYEWELKTKYGYKFMGPKHVEDFCGKIEKICNKVKGKKNPIKKI